VQLQQRSSRLCPTEAADRSSRFCPTEAADSGDWSTNLVIGQRESGDSTTNNLHRVHQSGDWSTTCLGRLTNHQMHAHPCPTNQVIGLTNQVTCENPSETNALNGKPFM
jgi:hypothetical protein